MKFKIIYPARHENLPPSVVEGLKQVALKSLGTVPEYQIFQKHNPHDLDYLICTCENAQGMVAFVSTIIIKTGNLKYMHLGLTCVDPLFQNKKIAQRLFRRVIVYAWKNIFFFQTLWLTNLACVLSSLGNVSRYFQEVFPSPNYSKIPSQHAQEIQTHFNESLREYALIPKSSQFDKKVSVFRNSTQSNEFYKSTDDKKYYHRKKKENDFYLKLMNKNQGDEVLQVGKMNAYGVISSLIEKAFRQFYGRFVKKKQERGGGLKT